MQLDSRWLVLRVYPDLVTLRLADMLLAKSAISKESATGTLAATACEHDVVVRFSARGDTTSASVWVDGALCGGTMLDTEPLEAAAVTQLLQRLESDGAGLGAMRRQLAQAATEAAREVSARRRAEAEIHAL